LEFAHPRRVDQEAPTGPQDQLASGKGDKSNFPPF
jgi:hypothetical protein